MFFHCAGRDQVRACFSYNLKNFYWEYLTISTPLSALLLLRVELVERCEKKWELSPNKNGPVPHHTLFKKKVRICYHTVPVKAGCSYLRQISSTYLFYILFFNLADCWLSAHFLFEQNCEISCCLSAFLLVVNVIRNLCNIVVQKNALPMSVFFVLLFFVCLLWVFVFSLSCSLLSVFLLLRKPL